MREFSVFVDSESVTANEVAEILSRGGFREDAFEVSDTAQNQTGEKNE